MCPQTRLGGARRRGCAEAVGIRGVVQPPPASPASRGAAGSPAGTCIPVLPQAAPGERARLVSWDYRTSLLVLGQIVPVIARAWRLVPVGTAHVSCASLN